MNLRFGSRTLLVLFVIAAPGLLGHDACRAEGMSLASIIGNNDSGTVTSGNLTFTFNKNTVLSSTFPQKTAPTLDTVFVSTVPQGVTFTFTPFLSVGGQTTHNYDVTISYDVMSTVGLVTAGLSFAGKNPESIGPSSNPDSSVSVTEVLPNDVALKVFMTRDADNKLATQNDQTAQLAGAPMTLSVTDTGNLFNPNRGGLDGSSYAELDSLTNTFAAPEPSSLVLASITALAGLCLRWRSSRPRLGW